MKKILIILFVLGLIRGHAQDQNRNYIKRTLYSVGNENNEGSSTGTSYQNFTLNIPANDLYLCPSGTNATGGATVSILNNVLVVNISTTAYCNIKLGLIKQLNTIPQLPDMDLGPIVTFNNLPSTSFYAIIKNGGLYFLSRHYVENIKGKIVKTFNGTPINLSTTSFPAPFSCQPTCPGCVANTTTLRIDGNTLIFDYNAGGPPQCNLAPASYTIPISGTLPNMELGVIQNYDHDTAFNAKIENNNLVIYTTETGPGKTNIIKINNFNTCLPIGSNPLLEGQNVVYFRGDTPTMSLNFDKKNSRFWAQEFEYDSFQRLSKTSYPVPLSCNVGYSYQPQISDTASLLYNFYSDNSEEAFTATASQPYTQNNYDVLNPGSVINTTGGNMVNGQWKTGYSYTLPAAQELYFMYGQDYFEGPMDGAREIVITKHFKTVNVDANGVESVVFTDGEGNMLASARSGGTTSQAVISLIGTQGFVDVHIPTGILTSQISFVGSASNYTVYNLRTGLIETTLVGGNFYRVVANTTPTVEPNTYITAGGVVWDSGNSQIRGIRYRVNYFDYTLNVYNQVGQLMKTVQPRGMATVSTIQAVPSHMNPAATNFITKYTYYPNSQLLSSIVSPDEGTVLFAYRRDGQLRYSQNSQQLAEGKVSYIEYDDLGRVIENGILTNSAAFSTFVPDTALISGSKSERSFYIYDYPQNITGAQLSPPTLSASVGINAAPHYVQKNLSGKLALTYNSFNGSTIDAITWYSYDVYGRTEWIVQWTPELFAKMIDYSYDVKGNITGVYYNKTLPSGTVSPDSFVHNYTYDVNNNLIKVNAGNNLATHAEYSYYLDGALKRAFIGGVQGIDYVYTLDGKLKSINAPSLLQSEDPGGDTNDLFGLSLDYYVGDYTRLNSKVYTSQTNTNVGNIDQYNGNVKAQRFANRTLDGTTSKRAYMYKYNRNNWLTDAYYGNVSFSSQGTMVIGQQSMYGENGISYDNNGNISTLKRTDEQGTLYDNLQYAYYPNTNRLQRVSDAVSASLKDYDLDAQSTNNYTYNLIGQLTGNLSENMTYLYNSSGLVTQANLGANPFMKLYYNERGQRIKKETFKAISPYDLILTEYYVVDEAGTIAAIYTKAGTSGSVVLKENPIYGLGRIGIAYRTAGQHTYSARYEITDHLGSVRAVFTNTNGVATMSGYADYYPYGELLPGRNASNGYKFYFQGQLLDFETTGVGGGGMEAFNLRLWEGRLGRWIAPDPKNEFHSPYLGMGNSPTTLIDPDGGSVESCCPNGKTRELPTVAVISTRVAKPQNATLEFNFVRNPPIIDKPIAPRASDDYWWNKLAYDGSRYAEYDRFVWKVDNDGYAVAIAGIIPEGGTVPASGGGARSALEIIKQGSKSWASAVNSLRTLKKVNIRVATVQEGKALLKEAFGNMNRVRRYKRLPQGSPQLLKRFEVHNLDKINKAREISVGNNLNHIKYVNGKQSGHIFFGE